MFSVWMSHRVHELIMAIRILPEVCGRSQTVAIESYQYDIARYMRDFRGGALAGHSLHPWS